MTSFPSIGIDMTEIEPIRKARFKHRVAEYFLTREELAVLPGEAHLPQYLASRFAVKEAVIKAFPEKLGPHDFMVTKRGPRPAVVFIAPERNAQYRVSVSLTHTRATAAAVALVELQARL